MPAPRMVLTEPVKSMRICAAKVHELHEAIHRAAANPTVRMTHLRREFGTRGLRAEQKSARERWRWTVSRVLFLDTLRCRGEDHSSRPAVAGGLEHSDPDTCASEEARRTGRPSWCPYSSLLREGFASPPVTRLSRVSSYLTFSPLPLLAQVGGVF